MSNIQNSRANTQNDPCRANNGGAALLMVLGLLSMFLIFSTGFSYMAVTQRMTATANADLVRANLIAESAVERVMGFMKNAFADDIYPGDSFFSPQQQNPWHGRSYLASVNSDTVGIERSLALAFNNLYFTPQNTLHNDVGWIPIRSKQRVNGVEKDVIIGRVAYLLMDESGKIDPGAVVSAADEANDETPFDGVPHVRTGKTPMDIPLQAAGIANADRFRPGSVLGGAAGLMPTDGNWYSMQHIARTIPVTQAEMDQFVRLLHPHSMDKEIFWRDKNNNNKWDKGEDEDRLNLAANKLDLNSIYSLFVGSSKLSTDDDCEWLKNLDHSPWMQEWKARTGMTTLQARQRVAAQIAANIIDYADNDSIPTRLFVDSQGNLKLETDASDALITVQGVERTWGVSEIAMRVEVEIDQAETHVLTSSIHINPNNASDIFFIMRTPTGQIDRDTLHANGASYTYTGPATSVSVKPMNQCNITIDGTVYSLDTNKRYTIHSSSMNVNLRNLNPTAPTWAQAKGHWWIDIDATNATITPDPAGGLPDVICRPAFKGEIFFPFAPDALTSEPPGILSVMYTVEVECATGKVGLAKGAVALELDTAIPVDGGTLFYCSSYTPAGAVTVEDALDPEGKPVPLDWYKIRLARIDSVTLRNGDEQLVAKLPFGNAIGDAFITWTQDGVATVTAPYYASVQAYDPMMNVSKEGRSDFTEFWKASPDLNYVSTTDSSAIGTLWGGAYRSRPYAGTSVANKPFERIGELGRVHSYIPGQSLRLWAATEADTAGSDAAILDLFKIGPDLKKQGRVNINTMNGAVLNALFSGVTTVNPADAAQAVIDKRKTGLKFRNRGELFSKVAGISGASPSNDEVEEAAVSKLAELVSVRQNSFSLLICAQSIKDVGGLPYDSNGDGTLDKRAQLNYFDFAMDASGRNIRYIDKVRAEQRILAVVQRDAISNRFRIERYELLD